MSAAGADEPQMSDSELAALFPHLFIGMPAASAAPVAARLPSSAAAPAACDDGDDGSCIICLDADRTAALVPCGHALLCGPCADKVLRSAAPACPVCREAATGCRSVGTV